MKMMVEVLFELIFDESRKWNADRVTNLTMDGIARNMRMRSKKKETKKQKNKKTTKTNVSPNSAVDISRMQRIWFISQQNVNNQSSKNEGATFFIESFTLF